MPGSERFTNSQQAARQELTQDLLALLTEIRRRIAIDENAIERADGGDRANGQKSATPRSRA